MLGLVLLVKEFLGHDKGYHEVSKIIILKNPNHDGANDEEKYSFGIEDVFLYGFEDSHLNELLTIERTFPDNSVTHTLGEILEALPSVIFHQVVIR